jgi:hypothetical protein
MVRVQFTLIHDSAEPEFEPVRSLALRIPIAGTSQARGQIAGSPPVEIRKAGDNEIWQLDADHLRQIAKGSVSVELVRSPGWAFVERDGRQIAFVMRDFWQTWPKSIALKPDGLHVRLLPPLGEVGFESRSLMDWLRHGYAFENGRYMLRRGIALRHEFWVRFGSPGDLDAFDGPDAWAKAVLSLPYAAVDPQRYCDSGVFGPIQPAGATPLPRYDEMVARNVALLLDRREKAGEYGWMNFGDWHGERTYNWGNNEYDLNWSMAVHFAGTGRWDYFTLGEQMARHYATIDTIHVPTMERMPGRVWTHCVGHVGVGARKPDAGMPAEEFLEWSETGYNGIFYRGFVDAGGHVYQEGNFAYYHLTGDRDLLEAAETVCAAQAAYLTPKFDFGIERSAGWPLINAVAAYESTGNPFYLNAARLYVERILDKQDPVGGGWLLPQPAGECDGQAGIGGKAFATGILLYGLMRYDLVEPREDVKHAFVEACRWLVEQTWNEDKLGFRYKTGCDKYRDDADKGPVSALIAPGLAYGFRLSGDPRFLDIATRVMNRICDYTDTMGKGVTMVTRQSAFALPLLSATSRPE